MLSGGERALTSIALIFALSQVNPPPFLVLDETDAALDEANSKKYGDMIETLSKHPNSSSSRTIARQCLAPAFSTASQWAKTALPNFFQLNSIDAVFVAK